MRKKGVKLDRWQLAAPRTAGQEADTLAYAKCASRPGKGLIIATLVASVSLVCPNFSGAVPKNGVSLSSAKNEVLVSLRAKLARKHGPLLTTLDKWPDNLRGCYAKRGYSQLWRLFAESHEPWQEGCCANGLPERKLLFAYPLEDGYIVCYKEAGFTVKQMADIFLLQDRALGFRGNLEITSPLSAATAATDLQRSIDETLDRRKYHRVRPPCQGSKHQFFVAYRQCEP